MPTPLFYNSYTKRLEPLVVHEPGKVRLYHCGPTVYKRQHIGNLRRFLFADFLRRSLEFLGYEVREITNITDVGHLTQDDIDAGEDKIARAAREQRVTPQSIAQKQTKLFKQDLQTLNIQPSHQYPRASQHIPQMQALIQTLVDKKQAYVTASGIYFDVASFPAYGALSGNTLQNLAAGKRIAVRADKKNPADFALWVFDPASLQRWDSPWGVGYPGWHIECSAMSREYLGSPIDIHTGGEDNRFPHHENEIAQSEAATGQRFVTLWLHNRHLQLGDQKLAKREGEQITLDTIVEKGFDPLAFRLFIFANHYRSPINFSWEELQVFQDHLASITQLLRRLEENLHKTSPAKPRSEVAASTTGDKGRRGGVQKPTLETTVITSFKAALADDLNTPAAWAVFLAHVKTINAALDSPTPPLEQLTASLATLHALDHVLGVLKPLEKQLADDTAPADIRALAQEREQARQAHHFPEADRLRDLISQRGYSVEDTPHGPRVMRK